MNVLMRAVSLPRRGAPSLSPVVNAIVGAADATTGRPGAVDRGGVSVSSGSSSAPRPSLRRQSHGDAAVAVAVVTAALPHTRRMQIAPSRLPHDVLFSFAALMRRPSSFTRCHSLPCRSEWVPSEILAKLRQSARFWRLPKPAFSTLFGAQISMICERR